MLRASNLGTPVTLTASVKPTINSTEPTGTVQFFEGTTLLGSLAAWRHGTMGRNRYCHVVRVGGG